MLQALIGVSQFSPLVAAIVTFLLGTFVYLKNKKPTLNQFFFAFSLSLSLWALGCFIQSTKIQAESAIFWDKIIYSAGALLPFFTLKISEQFTKIKRPFLELFTLTMGSLILAINWLGNFRSGVIYTQGSRFVTLPSFGWYLYVSVCTVVTAVIFYDYYQKVRWVQDYEERKRVFYFGMSLAALIGGGNCYFILVLKSFSPITDCLLNLCSSAMLSIFSLVMLLLITKQDLLDIKVLIARKESKLLTGLLVGLSFLLVWALPNIYLIAICSIALGLFWYGYGHNVQTAIQTPLEEKFLKGQYNVEKVVQEIAGTLFMANSKQEVMQSVTQEFSNSIQIKAVWSILSADAAATHYCVQRLKLRAGEETVELDDIPEDAPFITYFIQNPSIIEFNHLTEEVKETLSFEVFSGSLCIPLYSNKAFHGVFILGPKLSEEHYSSKDKALFSTIVSQVMVVFDRIEHQEKLRLSYEDVKYLNEALQEANNKLAVNLAEETRIKDKALHVAKELSHQAMMSTLMAGVSHEIRNPITSIGINMYCLAQRLGGHTIEPEEEWMNDEDDEASITEWRYAVPPQAFRMAVGQDRIEPLMRALTEQGYLNSEFEFTNVFNPTTFDVSFVELGKEWIDVLDNIKEVLDAQIRLKSAYDYFNMAQVQFNRILNIVDNMMKYGVSGGRVKKDIFTQISGVSSADSEAIFNMLIQKGYLDEWGGILEKFYVMPPDHHLELGTQFEPVAVAVARQIEATPGIIKSRTDINAVIESTLTVLAGSLHKKGIEIRRNLSENIPLVLGDSLRFQQAFFNIIFNAIQALEKSSPSQKEITLSTASCRFLNQKSQVVDGIEIIISDNGPGIPQEAMGKIFNPFFSTKSPTGGKNAGLGLSIVKDVIMNHGGFVHVESEIGRGTTFVISLPAYIEIDT